MGLDTARRDFLVKVDVECGPLAVMHLKYCSTNPYTSRQRYGNALRLPYWLRNLVQRLKNFYSRNTRAVTDTGRVKVQYTRNFFWAVFDSSQFNKGKAKRAAERVPG